MATGTVKFYNSQKGYGFITPDTGGKDVFVHATALERAGIRGLAEGQKVSYETAEDRRSGKPRFAPTRRPAKPKSKRRRRRRATPGTRNARRNAEHRPDPGIRVRRSDRRRLRLPVLRGVLFLLGRMATLLDGGRRAARSDSGKIRVRRPFRHALRGRSLFGADRRDRQAHGLRHLRDPPRRLPRLHARRRRLPDGKGGAWDDGGAANLPPSGG